MSLRDTRYGPYVLLPKATPDDCESVEEIIALSNIQSAIAQKNDLENKRAEIVRLTEKYSSQNLDAFHVLTTKHISQMNEEIGSLEAQISKALNSSILVNVIQKVYDRLIDEDIKALREKKIERQTKSASADVQTAPVSKVVLVEQQKPSATPVAQKPRVFISILITILSFVTFFLIYLVVALLASGIIMLLGKIPAISTLVNLLFSIRGDSPDMLIATLSPMIAYYFTSTMIKKLSKETPTMCLSFILLGAFILLVHIPSLLINLLGGEWFFANITQAVAGIVFIHKGHSSMSS